MEAHPHRSAAAHLTQWTLASWSSSGVGYQWVVTYFCSVTENIVIVKNNLKTNISREKKPMTDGLMLITCSLSVLYQYQHLWHLFLLFACVHLFHSCQLFVIWLNAWWCKSWLLNTVQLYQLGICMAASQFLWSSFKKYYYHKIYGMCLSLFTAAIILWPSDFKTHSHSQLGT